MSTIVRLDNLRARTAESLARVIAIYLADGASPVLSPDGIKAIEGALVSSRAEPGYAERNQSWLDRLAVRNKAGWPTERLAMLAAAQRAEDMRNKVIERLTK